MVETPVFPHFRPILLDDRPVIHDALTRYEPETSEWTFTNLFIWRSHYRFQWAMDEGWLIIVSQGRNGGPFALSPIGPANRKGVTLRLLQWLQEEGGSQTARIERADRRLVSELEGTGGLLIEPDRDQFDYVYRSEDLINLAGRKYHAKRNHINKFLRSKIFTYEPYGAEYLEPCLSLADRWCTLRRCEDDLNLSGEWSALKEALIHLDDLKLTGGVILMNGEVEAFSLGERLNRVTAIVHIEKADPEVPGLYAVINQQFCEHACQGFPFINREQDLGDPGLRKAKLSYYPDHLEEKFRITLL